MEVDTSHSADNQRTSGEPRHCPVQYGFRIGQRVRASVGHRVLPVDHFEQLDVLDLFQCVDMTSDGLAGTPSSSAVCDRLSVRDRVTNDRSISNSTGGFVSTDTDPD